jgi:uncharacterized protein (TIGR03067 family)
MTSTAGCRFTFGVRALFIAVAVCALMSAWVANRIKDGDRRRLRGEWDVAQMRANGMQYDTSRIERVDFDGDNVHIYWYGETLSYRVRLDGLRRPGQLDLISTEWDEYDPKAQRKLPAFWTSILGDFWESTSILATR